MTFERGVKNQGTRLEGKAVTKPIGRTGLVPNRPWAWLASGNNKNTHQSAGGRDVMDGSKVACGNPFRVADEGTPLKNTGYRLGPRGEIDTG